MFAPPDAGPSTRRRAGRFRRLVPGRPTPQGRAPPGRTPPTTPDAPDPGHDALLARWFDLTRRVLPGMAAAEGWPVRLDHCFMRVCLDAAFGRPWHEAVPRPAARNMTAAELARAVAVAERVAADPSLLPGLNAESLRLRGKARPLRRATGAGSRSNPR